jgi:hypothetical protein
MRDLNLSSGSIRVGNTAAVQQVIPVHHGNRSKDMLASPITLMFACLKPFILAALVLQMSRMRKGKAALPKPKPKAQLSPLLNSRKRYGSDINLNNSCFVSAEDFGDYDNNNMDVTEDIPGDFACKRSLSHIGNESTQSFATSEQPKPWCSQLHSLNLCDRQIKTLALKQATHSGNNTR